MLDFMSWLEASALARFMRETGPWTYAIVNLAHILGVATLFGSILILDLRLLGAWRRMPLALLADVIVPVATLGFVVAASTGVGLLATKATEYVGNPFLTIKLIAIAIGVANVLIIQNANAWRARRQRELSTGERVQLAVLGGVSLASWLSAIAAGRMIAYW